MNLPKTIDFAFLNACKLALLDINYLLVEGFDQNIHNTKIEGVKNTVKELKKIIQKYDPNWQLPDKQEQVKNPYLGLKVTSEGIELSDGGTIETPDDDGTIRRRDVHGNCEEIRTPKDKNYKEWWTLFPKKRKK